MNHVVMKSSFFTSNLREGKLKISQPLAVTVYLINNRYLNPENGILEILVKKYA